MFEVERESPDYAVKSVFDPISDIGSLNAAKKQKTLRAAPVG
jgi:hypothetical protein